MPGKSWAANADGESGTRQVVKLSIWYLSMLNQHRGRKV